MQMSHVASFNKKILYKVKDKHLFQAHRTCTLDRESWGDWGGFQIFQIHIFIIYNAMYVSMYQIYKIWNWDKAVCQWKLWHGASKGALLNFFPIFFDLKYFYSSYTILLYSALLSYVKWKEYWSQDTNRKLVRTCYHK